MGQPTVVGAGNDSNNYLDVRNEVHYTDQGTLRVDHQFNSENTGFVRYSAGGEHGFMPENLPGFGYLHDNLSQQGMGSYSHIFTPSLAERGDGCGFAAEHEPHDGEREQERHHGSAGDRGSRVRRSGCMGRAVLQRAGILADRRQLCSNADACMGHGGRRPRHAELAGGTAQLKFGGVYQRFIWPMWGFFQNRGYYQFTNGFTTDIGANDGTGSALASFPAGLAGGTAAAGRSSADEPAPVVRGWLRAGHISSDARTRPSTMACAMSI